MSSVGGSPPLLRRRVPPLFGVCPEASVGSAATTRPAAPVLRIVRLFTAGLLALPFARIAKSPQSSLRSQVSLSVRLWCRLHNMLVPMLRGLGRRLAMHAGSDLTGHQISGRPFGEALLVG